MCRFPIGFIMLFYVIVILFNISAVSYQGDRHMLCCRWPSNNRCFVNQMFMRMQCRKLCRMFGCAAGSVSCPVTIDMKPCHLNFKTVLRKINKEFSSSPKRMFQVQATPWKSIDSQYSMQSKYNHDYKTPLPPKPPLHRAAIEPVNSYNSAPNNDRLRTLPRHVYSPPSMQPPRSYNQPIAYGHESPPFSTTNSPKKHQHLLPPITLNCWLATKRLPTPSLQSEHHHRPPVSTHEPHPSTLNWNGPVPVTESTWHASSATNHKNLPSPTYGPEPTPLPSTMIPVPEPSQTTATTNDGLLPGPPLYGPKPPPLSTTNFDEPTANPEPTQFIPSLIIKTSQTHRQTKNIQSKTTGKFAKSAIHAAAKSPATTANCEKCATTKLETMKSSSSPVNDPPLMRSVPYNLHRGLWIYHGHWRYNHN